MAKQKGIFKVQGSIGDASFSKGQDGYRVREKSGISADMFSKSDAFVRTRENAAEFGRAGKAGKLLRQSIRILLKNAKDGRVTSRLTREMMKVVKSDPINDRGMRTAAAGEAGLLKGFEFNIDAVLNTVFFAAFTTEMDRASGKTVVAIQSFTPTKALVAPEGSTHFTIVCAAVEADFDGDTTVENEAASAVLPINNELVPAITLTMEVTPDSTHPIFVVVGIQYAQVVNGKNYPLKTSRYNALGIVEVSAA
jgi:hypothetical protein